MGFGFFYVDLKSFRKYGRPIDNETIKQELKMPPDTIIHSCEISNDRIAEVFVEHDDLPDGCCDLMPSVEEVPDGFVWSWNIRQREAS